MPGSTAVRCPVEKYPATAQRKPRLHSRRPLQNRRRVKKSNLPLAGVCRRPGGAVDSGRRSDPETPLLRWKFDDAELSGKPPEAGVKSCWKAKNCSGRAAPTVSARKLAVGIWHLQLMEATRSRGAGREATDASLGFQHHHENLQLARACNGSNADLHLRLKNGFSSSIPPYKTVSSAIPNPAMERATKWDSGRASEDVFQIFDQLKLFEDQQMSTASIISSLQVELEGARSRIHELEAERKSSKKKLDNFLRKLAEEKASWRTREHEKVRTIIDGMRGDLSRERKNRRRVEIVNSKLVNELAEAKLSSKRLLQDYEKERRERELMEEVCDELAKEIGEDRAEVETLKRESMKIREEVEEERKMLQMAEVWREERVQMKLIDAKLALEDKYLKLSKLEAELEAFLRAGTGRSPDISEVRQAELLKEAVDLVKIEKSNEFTYQPPPASEDLFAVFEELHPKVETNERDIEPCYGYSPATHESNIHSVSPATDVFLEEQTRRCSNVDTEDDSDWETLSPGEEQGLSDSLGGSEPSVNAVCEESNASVSGTDRERNEGNGEVSSEFCTVTATQPRKKGASITRLWRSSCPKNGEINKKNSVELLNGRLSDGRMSNLALSPDSGLGVVELSLPRIDRWSSPDSVNPHVTHGMKGCIEWPGGSQKHSLKAKLLEARIESQKTQLRHILKQKI